MGREGARGEGRGRVLWGRGQGVHSRGRGSVLWGRGRVVGGGGRGCVLWARAGGKRARGGEEGVRSRGEGARLGRVGLPGAGMQVALETARSELPGRPGQ